MNFRQMTVGKKITLGFAVVLLLLVVASLLSYTGIGGIVENAEEVIAGNKLDGNLAQKEVDHLNWANQVNALLSDEKITQLTVQTDPHKCAFGEWLYGEGRQQAEILVPELAPLLVKIEEPHAKLHGSATEIAAAFKPADAKLPGFLAEKEVDHMKWSAQICQFFLANKAELNVQEDPRQCAFGKWYYGPEAKAAIAANPELAEVYKMIEDPHAKLHATATAIKETYRQQHPGLLETLLDLEIAHRVWADTVATAIIKRSSNLAVETDSKKCALGKWLQSDEAQKYMASFPELAEAIKSIEEAHDELHRSAGEISQYLKNGDPASAGMIYRTTTSVELDKVAKGLRKAIAAEQKLVKGYQQAKNIYENETLPLLATTGGLIQEMREVAQNSLDGQKKANQIFANQTIPALQQTQSLLGEIRKVARENIMTDQVMLDAAQGTRLEVSLISIAAIVIGLLLATFIARGISGALRKISGEIDMGAEQVASASEQVAGASQSLAEGASEQASSLEETSASMEEMASMTRQNADNSNQADKLMSETSKVVDKANHSMQELRKAMDEINTASDETAKIIKTIDEIAFQTNLLALNAAVEAARAGEAGAGFAVVADEVRSLALRAAEAAKNTQELITGNIENIRQGSDLVNETDNAFSEVAQSNGKVAELVSEISSASEEQSQGINQMNAGLGQMDRVTQQNASGAEESASAAEELSSQAMSMQDVVKNLLAMVGSSNGNGNGRRKTIAVKRPEKALPPAEDSTDW